MGIRITFHGYDNVYDNVGNNPMYNGHKNMGAHYTQQTTVVSMN